MSHPFTFYVFYLFQYSNLPTVNCKKLRVHSATSAWFRILIMNEKVIDIFFNLRVNLQRFDLFLMAAEKICHLFLNQQHCTYFFA